MSLPSADQFEKGCLVNFAALQRFATLCHDIIIQSKTKKETTNIHIVV